MRSGETSIRNRRFGEIYHCQCQNAERNKQQMVGNGRKVTSRNGNNTERCGMWTVVALLSASIHSVLFMFNLV